MSKLPTGAGRCTFSGITGKCQEVISPGRSLCFWHDPEVDKSGQEVRASLELRAKTGLPMEGFILRGVNLDHVDLVNHDGKEPYRLINSDLSRASLSHGHLYRVDLSGSRLLKANLSYANLHRADLAGCNLLGVNLKNALLEHVHWGRRLYQEEQAERHPEQAVELYQEAEETARNIRRHCENQGMTSVAGRFYYQERVLQRRQMPRFSRYRLLSWLVDKISGYGESPLRVISFSLVLILSCSFIYLFGGLQGDGKVLRFDHNQDFASNLHHWLDCLYFSVVTFTTLGYGDLTPVGPSRIVAACEAFTGSFSLALFVVIFVRKMIR